MKRIAILALFAVLSGCTNLSQCAAYAPDSKEHAACIKKVYDDAANASVAAAPDALYTP